MKNWLWKRKSKIMVWVTEAILVAVLALLSVHEASGGYNSAAPALQRQVDALVIRLSDELATPAGEVVLKSLLFYGIAYGIPVIFIFMWAVRFISWTMRADRRLEEKRAIEYFEKRELF